MGSFGAEIELAQTLVAAGNSLLNPPPSTDGLLSLLDEIESLLSNVEQDPPVSMQDALLPSMKALISVDLLRHPDPDVRVSVVSCLTEITRITAPEAPYDDDQMKEIFQLTVEAFGMLADLSCRNYKKAELILDTVSKVRSCLVMLDLECNKLILEMFQELLKIISHDHPRSVLQAIEMIMITVIDESEEVSMDLLDILLVRVRKENENISSTSWRLVENVLSRCARKLKPYIKDALKSTGTTLDTYSPVVSSIFQSESGSPKEHKIVSSKENEADEKRLVKRAVPSGSLEETLNVGLSRKRIRSGSISRHLDDSSKRAVRGGTDVTNEVDRRSGSIPSLLKVKQSSKQGQPKSTDVETESGGTLRKRGRKPNSLLNPEEGYDHSGVPGGRDSHKVPSGKKMREKGLGNSSLGNPDAMETTFPEERTSFPPKVDQMTQSVVISLPSPYGIMRGPRKRSRARTEEIDKDKSSLPSPTTKKEISSIQAKKKGSPSSLAFMKTEVSDEEYLVASNQEGFEKTENGRMAAKSGKKAVFLNHLEKTSMKKSVKRAKMGKTSGKGLVIRSHLKENHTEGSNPDGVVSRSSKSKKMDSQDATRPLVGPEETPKSHPKRKRTARKEVDSEAHGSGVELVGKKIKVWWPLDKMFYEGVIKSYDDEKKKHLVLYSDGETESLNLNRQRWEFIEDSTPAKADQETDLPESMTLSGIRQRQKAHKNKNASTPVTTSSSEIRSSKSTLKKKDAERENGRQAERVKDKATKQFNSASKAESEEPDTGEGGNLKSLKEMNADPHQAEPNTVADQKRKMNPAVPGENKDERSDAQEPRTKGEVDVEDQKSLNELKSVKESNAETETGGGGQKSPKEPDAETETGEGQTSLKEPNTETEAGGEGQKSPKEPDAEGNEAKEQEDDEKTCTSMSENGKPESRLQGDSMKEANAESGERGGVASSDLSVTVEVTDECI